MLKKQRLPEDYIYQMDLDNVLKNPQYEISEAIVFCNENIQEKDGVLYCPIYLAGLLKKQRLPEDYIYQMDLSILQDD